MTSIPSKLAELLEEIADLEPDMRADLLIEIADEFEEVPESIASRPYLDEDKIPGCESEVYAFCKENEGAKEFFFAVENPQGISAKAMARIFSSTLQGASSEEISAIPEDVIYKIFGRTLSMGKGQGLMSMLGAVKVLAARGKS